jgi:TctA family transporter
MIFFGLIGYLLRKYRYEAAPLIWLCSWSHAGRCLEAIFDHFRRKPEDFFTRPISGQILVVTILLLLSPLLPKIQKKRQVLPLDKEN